MEENVEKRCSGLVSRLATRPLPSLVSLVNRVSIKAELGTARSKENGCALNLVSRVSADTHTISDPYERSGCVLNVSTATKKKQNTSVTGQNGLNKYIK